MPEHRVATALGATAPVWTTRQPGRFRQANERRPWLAPAVTGAAVAVATAYTSWQDPNASGVFPACPLRAVTGFDCPGCGGLRATHALTHGDVAGALGHNVIVTIALPIVALLWALWLLHSLGVRVPRPRLPRMPQQAWWGLAAAVLLFTVVRNIPGVGFFEFLNSTT